MDPQLRRLLAELICKLQVPRSISVMGLAEKPYDGLRHLFGCFGWQSAEEIEKVILKWEGKMECQKQNRNS